MAAVTICSDFGAPKLKSATVSIISPSIYHKVMASGPITSWQIDGETVDTVADSIFFGIEKSLQMVTAAMKLKDPYSLEGKL